MQDYSEQQQGPHGLFVLSILACDAKVGPTYLKKRMVFADVASG